MSKPKINHPTWTEEDAKKRGRGRPPIEIQPEVFENLCRIGCSQTEIASYFHCSVDTIQRWCKRTYDMYYQDIMAEYQEIGKIKVREMQMDLAKTSPQMAIWLGKQMLGQTERRNYEFSGSLPVVIQGEADLED